MDRQLFLEDLKGINGVAAQEIALSEIERMLDPDFINDEDYDELQEQVEQYEETLQKIAAENEALALDNRNLREANRLLKAENQTLGDYLDELLSKEVPQPAPHWVMFKSAYEDRFIHFENPEDS
jgi:regulator of replication initiation timing